jgi:hypothetical protein
LPSSTTDQGDVLGRRGGGLGGARGTDRVGAGGQVGGEALGTDAVGGHAGLDQGVLGRGDHLVGAADEDLVHAAHRQQGLDDVAHLAAVDAALQQVHFLGLARQHVDHGQAVAVAVLEVLQGLVEHHRGHAAVAVDQGELGIRAALPACSRRCTGWA